MKCDNYNKDDVHCQDCTFFNNEKRIVIVHCFKLFKGDE